LQGILVRKLIDAFTYCPLFFFQKVAAKKNESLQIIDMFNLFTLNSLVKETALGIRPPNAQVNRFT
jgi:glycosylphosphatidylinositol transamidase (GPIT) subunit GPI8